MEGQSMGINDRTQLTAEEAYELVKKYSKQLWPDYRNTLGREMDWEDLAQDVMIKLLRTKENPDFDPDWKPGDIAYFKKTRGEDSPKREVDTSYMLKPDYNPNDPYDSIYHLMHQEEFNYLDKYNGRITSKAYYIARIVKTTLADKADKRDRMRYADSLDREIGDEGNMTVADRVADPEEDVAELVYKEADQEIIMDMIHRILGDLDMTPFSPRVVGWSPISGQLGPDGEHIDTPLSARDVGLFLLYGYEPNDVVEFYHDKNTGNKVSLATIKKYWKASFDIMCKALLADRELVSTGIVDKFMDGYYARQPD